MRASPVTIHKREVVVLARTFPSKGLKNIHVYTSKESPKLEFGIMQSYCNEVEHCYRVKDRVSMVGKSEALQGSDDYEIGILEPGCNEEHGEDYWVKDRVSLVGKSAASQGDELRLDLWNLGVVKQSMGGYLVKDGLSLVGKSAMPQGSNELKIGYGAWM